ncbi:uncharacterized protein KZ484_003024 [Pholidichthys leucotaenia]
MRNLWNERHFHSNYFPPFAVLSAAQQQSLHHLQQRRLSIMVLQTFLLLTLRLSTFPSLVSPRRHELGCFKVNSCKCIMKDGSGVINLRAMGDGGGFLGRLVPVAADETVGVGAEVLLTLSPCLDFSQPEELMGGDCTNVAVCLRVRHQGLSQDINYGRHEGNEFHYNDTLGLLSISYFAHGERPLTVVHYHCNPNQSTSVTTDCSLTVEGQLQVWVESPCACPNACAMGDLGLGTIFLILLSLSAAAYFILGSCALRPFRSGGGGGIQISPEPSVWCTICYLCTDGRPQEEMLHRYDDTLTTTSCGWKRERCHSYTGN